MPISTPQLIGTASTSAATTTLSITVPAGGVPAGAAIIVGIANHNNLAPTSVTDSAGNTYTVHLSPANGTTVTISIASALSVTALTSGQTITVTWSSGRNAAVSAYYVTGLATSSAIDQTASQTAGTGTAATVGPSAATTQASEIVIGAFGYSGTRTFTAGSGYAALTGAESTTTIRGVAWEYQIVSATGTQTATGTFSTSVTYAGALATFKAAGGGGTPISVSDTATAAEGIGLARTIGDSGSAAETIGVVNTTPNLADTGATSELVSIRNLTPSLSDSGSAAETITVQAVTPPTLVIPARRLHLGLYDGPTGRLIRDCAQADGVEFSTDQHGPKACRFSLPLSLREAYRLYDRAGLPWVIVSSSGKAVWRGRLEDAQLQFTRDGSGAQLQAFGLWRALTDLPYTALWSTTRVAEWRPVETVQQASRNPKLYMMDTNNRVFIGLNKNATYQSNSDAGEYYFSIPSGGRRSLQTVNMTYEINLPAGWRANLNSYSSANFGGATAVWTVVSSGGMISGSTVVTVPSGRTIGLYIYNDSGVAYGPFAGENGTQYAQFTNIRVTTTSSSAVFADEIARDMVAAIGGNGGLRTSTALIQSPGLDVTDEVYEDASMAAILDRLAALGDNQSPPGRWEVGVDVDRALYLRPRGSAARQWYIDVGELELERTLETLTNSVYAVYTDATRVPQRTPPATDSSSVAQWGITRQRALRADTTSLTQAITQRDAALTDGADPQPRARLRITRLYDAYGQRWPLWSAVGGDRITIRNLPAARNTAIDRVRTFDLAETTYRLDDDTLDVVPDVPVPTLDTVLARRG